MQSLIKTLGQSEEQRTLTLQKGMLKESSNEHGVLNVRTGEFLPYVSVKLTQRLPLPRRGCHRRVVTPTWQSERFVVLGR